jgi:Glucosamine 6-phosphate synthetase, contains amidotransferase and phosphosugar isomerase domains
MIAAEATEGTSLQDAVRQTLRHVEGTYGLVVLDTKNPHELVVARNGSPIVLGIGESEMFVASDVAALVRYTKQVVYLDDAEWPRCTPPTSAPSRRRAGPARAGRAAGQEADHGGGRGRGLRARLVRELHAQGDPRAAGGAAPGPARPARRAVRHGQAGRHRPGRPPAQVDQAGEVPRLRLGLLRRADGRGADEELARIPSDAEPARSSGTAIRSSTPTRSTWR